MEEFVVVEWLGITWFRPNNLITNLIVGIVGVILCIRVYQMNQRRDTYLYYWMLFFLLVGVGGAIGGFAHAFNYDFPEIRHTFLHKIAWTVGGVGLLAGQIASIMLLRSQILRQILSIVSISVTVFYIFMLYYSQLYQIGAFNHFELVRYNSAFAVVGIIFSIHVYSYLKDKNPGALYVGLGILSLVLTIPLYNFQISLHEWFDYNDISHFLEIFCLILIYMGVRKGYEQVVRPRLIATSS